MVVPEALLGPFTDLRGSIDDYPALALQPALHTFFEEGHFAAHIRRQRKLYADRQQVLINALDKHANGLLTTTAHEAGMHLIADIGPVCGMSDQEISTRAGAAGLAVPALSRYFEGTKRKQGLVLGYAGLEDWEIDQGIRKLVRLITDQDS